MYQNKTIHVATKHNKERVIKPAFEVTLHCKIESTEGFDTDRFGTFSGEIERKLSAYETCVAKAKTAAQQFNLDYVIASEGSFGPHPTLFFMPANVEILVFFDAKANLIIEENLISTDTNYAHHNLSENDKFDIFLNKIIFPSHRVILKDVDSNTVLVKGIDHKDKLISMINHYKKIHKSLWIETDMRAMYNPTRMKNIEKLALKLAKRISQSCPSCHYPGFGKLDIRGYLPCKDCGSQTSLYKNKILKCIYCNFEISEERDDNMQYAKPEYCIVCNP